MDYKQLQKEVIAAIRGKKTQGQINKRLGYKFNQVHRWESGRTKPSWNDFLSLAKICRFDAGLALEKSFGYYGKPQDLPGLIRHFLGPSNQSAAATSLGVSRATVSRWLSGKVTPSLDQVLALMDTRSVDLFRFLEHFAERNSLPIIRDRMNAEMRQAQLYYTFPWISALLSAIDLAEYRRRPSDAFLAEKSRLSLTITEQTIAALAKEGLLKWNGTLWETSLPRFSLRGSAEDKKKVGRFIFGRTLASVEKGYSSNKTRHSWKLFSLNQNQYERIVHKYNEFFHELGTIIDESQDGADKIFLFTMALCDLEVLPGFDGSGY